MGLDMYAYSTPEKIRRRVDFDVDRSQLQELHYWRKHPNLHGWMEQLYRSKGGEDESFNCVNVRLTEEDLNKLDKAIRSNKLPSTGGFFFGESQLDPEEVQDDLQFVEDAKAAIKKGETVFYTSWW